jgi:hypothetical protein
MSDESKIPPGRPLRVTLLTSLRTIPAISTCRSHGRRCRTSQRSDISGWT